MQRTVLIAFSLALASAFSSQAALPKVSSKSLEPAALGKAADSAKLAAEAASKKKADSLKAEMEAAKKRAEDSAKAKAAEIEKRVKDSLNTLMGKKEAAKPAPAPKAEPKATVVEAVPEPAKAAPAGCSVTKLVFAAKVENREPSGEAQEFPAGLVSCWARVACGADSMTVNFVWSKDGSKAYDIPVHMKHSGRAWTNATVTAGKWKVSVMKGGSEIGSGEMTVK